MIMLGAQPDRLPANADDRAFDGPAFAACVRDMMRDVQQHRLAQFNAILDANERGDREGIVGIVQSLIQEEQRCSI